MEKSAKLTFEVDLPGGQDRLRELVLYVCGKCQGSERFGKVKLNKIIWRADFAAFWERRVPVSGRSYHRLAAGPAPIEMPLVLAELRDDRLIEIKAKELDEGYVEERIVALAHPNMTLFSADDIKFVDEAIGFYWSKSASYASDLSHGVAWRSRKFLDPMPYESAFLSNNKMRPEHAERFAEMGRKKGWHSL